MATIDWKTLWPLNGTQDFISLEHETRSAFRVAHDSAIGQVATFYHQQLAKYEQMPYETFMLTFEKWIPKESLQLLAAQGTPNEQKMEAFYLALREAHARQHRKREAPTQMALDYIYNQSEGANAAARD